MNFDDSPEEAAFRNEARAWIDTNHPADWRQILAGDFLETLDQRRAWQAKKADAGWACLTWPKQYGGRGATPMESAIWAQEEAELAALSLFTVIGVGMAGPTLMAHGSEQQKRDLLPPLARGDQVWCQLFSEPGAGSDLAGIRTRAERAGDDWIVNGQKIWTSFAHIADWGLLVTRTDPSVPKHKGLTYFFFDMKAPGVEVKPIKQISGDTEFNEVYLTDMRVPDHQRLGEVGDGWKVSLTTLMSERSAIGTAFTSTIDALIEQCAKLTIGGIPALEHPAVLDRLADYYVDGAGLRNTNLRMLSALSKGRKPGPEASIGKLVAGRQRQDEASFALDLQNYTGILRDPDVAVADGKFQFNYFRCAGNRIEGGSDEILRNIIAERVLGLPAEPRVDKDLRFSEIPTGSAK